MDSIRVEAVPAPQESAFLLGIMNKAASGKWDDWRVAVDSQVLLLRQVSVWLWV